MHFSGGINRPPYETADGYLQTTDGCSHNAEYADLLSGKKAAYAEYRKLRDEAQELLIAQSNIGSIYDFAGGKLLRQEKEEQKR